MLGINTTAFYETRLSWVVRGFLLNWASFTIVYMTVLEILGRFCGVSFAGWGDWLVICVWGCGSTVVGKEVYDEDWGRRRDVGVIDVV